MCSAPPCNTTVPMWVSMPPSYSRVRSAVANPSKYVLDKLLWRRDIAFMPRYTLETIILILVILWLLGWLVFPFAGSLIHLLIVLILVVVLVRLLQGRRPWP